MSAPCTKQGPSSCYGDTEEMLSKHLAVASWPTVRQIEWRSLLQLKVRQAGLLAGGSSRRRGFSGAFTVSLHGSSIGAGA